MRFYIVGAFLYDTIHGFGKYSCKNGDLYIGNQIHGCRFGTGRMEWRNGNIYTGNWKNDIRTGNGKMEWHDGGQFDGNIYEGEFNLSNLSSRY